MAKQLQQKVEWQKNFRTIADKQTIFNRMAEPILEKKQNGKTVRMLDRQSRDLVSKPSKQFFFIFNFLFALRYTLYNSHIAENKSHKPTSLFFHYK